MEAPVSVSHGVVCCLPAKLERLLSPEAGHGLLKREKNSIRLLKEDIQQVIDKYMMEPSEVEAPTSSTVRCWAKEVREVSYDIDDFLDELNHRLQGAAAADQTNNLYGKIAVVREGLRRSRWAASETSRFRARLEEAIQRHKRYNLDKCQTRPIGNGIDSEESPIPPPHVRLVGIDRSMEKLGEWLAQDGEPQLRVVSIIGFGGVGKTTLAKELYRRLRWQFECRAFVQSSQKPDMRTLLTSILSQVRPHQLPSCDLELPNLIDTIRAYLQHKKYFIVIDDLWASSTWDFFRHAFPDDKCFSRVLTTTEIDIVAQRCSGHNSQHIFAMGPLSEDESRKLFFSRVLGNQSGSRDRLYEVLSIIVRKFGGFPLATVTTAGLFARQHNWVEHCDYIRRSLRSNLRTNPTTEGMKQVLSLCYDSLPNRLKPCMLHLSIYKEGHVIWKDDLVKQWISEGFICGKEGKQMVNVAGSYFDELVSAGLIQPVDVYFNGEVLSCTLHYMVLNLIRYKSIEENFVISIDNSQTNTKLADKVRRLSIQFGNTDDAEPPTNLRLSQVRTLAFFGLLKSLPSIVEFPLLRILILHLWGDQENISLSLSAVYKLFRLRYLEVVCNGTVNLETDMHGLQHLETLKIDCKISEVPQDIVHLPGLLHLSLPGNTSLPNGFGRMASLQALESFDISNNSADNVLNLGNLTNLQDLRLTCSTMPSDILEKLQCFGSTVSKLKSLKSLIMLPAGSYNENTLKSSALSNIIFLDVLSSVSSPPFLLQKLELPRICIFSTLPRWIRKLHQLSVLKIQVLVLSSDDVDILKGLPALTALSLYIRITTAQRIVFGKDGFPVLKYFKFICPALCIAFMEGTMPNLQRLKLGFDANTVTQFNPVVSGFEHLTGLEEISAKVGRTDDDESNRMAAQSALEAGFCPRRVNIQWVNWAFYSERECSTYSQKEKYQTTENLDPIPDVVITEGTEGQYGIGEMGSCKDTNKQADRRITLSLKCSDNQEIQQRGSVDNTSKQADTGNPVASKSSLHWKTADQEHKTCTETQQGEHQTQQTQNDIMEEDSKLQCGFEEQGREDTKKYSATVLHRMQTTVSNQSDPKVQMQSITGQWVKGKLICCGMFGCVYEATNRHSGALCVMKEVHMFPDDAKIHGHLKQLEQKLNFLCQLKHENIVQYYGSEIIDDRLYIYLEYVYPGAIQNYINQQSLLMSESVIRNFMPHILKGLAFLHSKNIMHRDIKGSNLLVDGNGVVKLADFEITKHLINIAPNLSLKATYWMAPEVIRATLDKSASYGLAVDIWSLGCTVIELLTGKPPWSDFEGLAAMFKVLRTDPPIPDNLSPEGKNFLQLCFTRNPAERPTASRLLEHPFIKNSFAGAESPVLTPAILSSGSGTSSAPSSGSLAYGLMRHKPEVASGVGPTTQSQNQNVLTLSTQKGSAYIR